MTDFGFAAKKFLQAIPKVGHKKNIARLQNAAMRKTRRGSPVDD